jgi:alpha-tubulin suppressor-like RCC1 family protein
MLGAGTPAPACSAEQVTFCSATPLRVAGNARYRQIAAGEFHTCALVTDGAIDCWGWNSNGQIGNNGPGNAVARTPARITSSRVYRAVGAGSRHVCAVTIPGQPECWGRNGAGEIGIDAGVSIASPAAFSSPASLLEVDAGETHSCALSADFRVFCWGSLLGNGTENSSKIPMQAALETAEDVDAGAQHTCAVSRGDLWCWGSNSHAQLGVTGVARSNAPQRVEIVR